MTGYIGSEVPRRYPKPRLLYSDICCVPLGSHSRLAQPPFYIKFEGESCLGVAAQPAMLPPDAFLDILILSFYARSWWMDREDGGYATD